MAKHELTEIEKFFVDNNPNLSLEELSQKLRRAEKTISNYLKDRNQEPPFVVPEPVTPPPAPSPQPDPQVELKKTIVSGMIGKSRDGKTTTAVVMTTEAAELADSVSKQTKPSRVASKCTSQVNATNLPRKNN